MKPEWNNKLLAAGDHLYQMPFFNEGFRASGRTWVSVNRNMLGRLRGLVTSAVYLQYGSGGEPNAYACLTVVGMPGVRVAPLGDGPVSLNGDEVSMAAIRDLCQWAAREGIVCIRVNSWDSDYLDTLSRHFGADRVDSVAIMPDLSENLVVEPELCTLC